MQKYKVIIVGSGAAGYSAADWLSKFGVKNIAVLTECRHAGTSRNAGSDKQTYYKLSFTQADSAGKMAEDLASGGGMHRDTALIEAANSIRCFMRLVDYGVPFPTDEIGRFIGYRTDHDNTARGTSAGPLTSKYITEALERSVQENPDIHILDCTTVIRVVTNQGRAVGVICLSPSANGEARLFSLAADNVILATGGAAKVYADSVYPPSQSGALGLAVEAGCVLNNLTEWQYGIASKKVRWNLSGSYQQVIPTYYSVDAKGNRHDFLADWFDSPAEICNAIFLKGYQWPFDSAKTEGSSRIDLSVSAQTIAGRRVWMDFRQNPPGFDRTVLSPEAQAYLEQSGAPGKTPIERLMQMNPQAAALYRAHGIDLTAEPLEISVCAQHMNGGADVDIHWQTSVCRLFAIGEAAGTFGIYRPGGSALNSTQVGALRAAEYIAREPDSASDEDEEALNTALQAEAEFIRRCTQSPCALQTDFSAEMSRCAAHCRIYEEIEKLYDRLIRQTDAQYYTMDDCGFAGVHKLFKYRDNLAAQRALCGTLLQALPITGSRGGAVFYRNGSLVPENTAYRDRAVVTAKKKVCFETLRPALDTTYNFEQTWRRYQERRGCRSINLQSATQSQE